MSIVFHLFLGCIFCIVFFIFVEYSQIITTAIYKYPLNRNCIKNCLWCWSKHADSCFDLLWLDFVLYIVVWCSVSKLQHQDLYIFGNCQLLWWLDIMNISGNLLMEQYFSCGLIVMRKLKKLCCSKITFYHDFCLIGKN